MRFAELQLLKYGRFEDCTLTFEPGECDLQIVFGPNEAGKSTTLAAVGDLLFGFPHVTPYAFRFDRQLLRVGAVIEDGGISLPVRRRKGTGQTLLGADDQPIDPGPLAAALGAQTRESFERMFGLDHERLRKGGQAILDARDDVGQALFAAGSGLVRVTQVCAELEAAAKAIWTPRAGESRTYTAAARAYQEARGVLKAVQVRPAQWTQASRALSEAEAQLTGLRSERAALALQNRTLERRRRILLPVAQRQAVLDQAQALGETPELAPDAGERFEAALQAADRARTQIELAATRIGEVEESLAAAQPRADVLEAGPEIGALRELKGAVDQSLADLPKVRAECETHQARMATLQGEIGWPQEAASDAKARLPGRPVLAELRDILERRSGIDQQAQSARDGLEEAGATLGRLKTQVEAFPPAAEIQPLQAAVRKFRDAGDLEARVQSAADVRLELEQLLKSRLNALKPWSGDAEALRALGMPADEDVDTAIDAIETAQDRAAAERTARDTEAERLEQLRLDRDQATRTHPTPSMDDLAATRRDRQAAWTPLKAQLLGEAPTDDPAAAAATFEREVSGADSVADERFDGAEHAGGLAAMEREIEKSALRLRQADDKVTRYETELAQAGAVFSRLVAPLGFAITPQVYESWRENRTLALEAAKALGTATAALAAATTAEAAARELLVEGLGDGASTTAPRPLRRLMAEADIRLEAAAAAQARHDALRAQIEAAETAEQRAQVLSRSALEAVQAWTALWTPALKNLSLPADAGRAGVRSRLELIDTLRTEVDEILGLQPRIAQMSAFVTDFETGVGAVAKRIGQTVAASAGETLNALAEAAATAASQSARANDLAGDLETAREEKRVAEAGLAQAEAELKPLLALAPEGDPMVLRQIIARAAEAARLRGDLSRLEAEILGHGEGRLLAELVEEAQGADPDGLASEAETLAQQIQSLNADIERQSEIRAAAELDFKPLDDRPDAAIAAFEMAEARSEMAFQAELYIRKRAEAKLLRAAVDRYRREKQGPLLTRASDLFQTLTVGRYLRLMVEYDGDAPKLAGLRDDGATVVPVDGMSQGTVDQLFLALRIAAVEDAVTQGARLPFLADDLFINFDDERAAAGFKVLAELAAKTQVLFFTHHEHLLEVAKAALQPAKVSVCGLDREPSAPRPVAVSAA
jgi:uncharacterized protein YhaN